VQSQALTRHNFPNVGERGEKLINPTNFLLHSGNLLRHQHLSTELYTTFVDNLELQTGGKVSADAGVSFASSGK
jgi:hypothetical protein